MGASTRKQKGGQKGGVKLTNPGQVVSWHKYPEINHFLPGLQRAGYLPQEDLHSSIWAGECTRGGAWGGGPEVCDLLRSAICFGPAYLV